MSDGKVQLRTRDENFIERLYAEDGTLLCEYKPFNEDVKYIEYGENQKLPITLYTKDGYDEVREILNSIKDLWITAVFVEGIWFIVQYKKKKKQVWKIVLIKVLKIFKITLTTCENCGISIMLIENSLQLTERVEHHRGTGNKMDAYPFSPTVWAHFSKGKSVSFFSFNT